MWNLREYDAGPTTIKINPPTPPTEAELLDVLRFTAAPQPMEERQRLLYVPGVSAGPKESDIVTKFKSSTKTEMKIRKDEESVDLTDSLEASQYKQAWDLYGMRESGKLPILMNVGPDTDPNYRFSKEALDSISGQQYRTVTN